MLSMLHLTMLVLPVEEVPYTNNGGVPIVPVAVISRLICDSLPGQRLDSTNKLIEVPETRLFLLRCIRREQLRKHHLNLSAIFGSNNNKSTDITLAIVTLLCLLLLIICSDTVGARANVSFV